MKQAHVVDKAYISLLHGNGELILPRCEMYGVEGLSLGVRQSRNSSSPAIFWMTYEKAAREVEYDLSVSEVQWGSIDIRWVAVKPNSRMSTPDTYQGQRLDLRIEWPVRVCQCVYHMWHLSCKLIIHLPSWSDCGLSTMVGASNSNKSDHITSDIGMNWLTGSQ
jgi:hypothetical protein